MISDQRTEPTARILGEVLSAATDLVRNEVDLARAEATDSLKSAAVGVGLLAAALVVAMVALNLLTGAIVGFLVAQGWMAGSAAMIVCIGIVVIAGILVSVGLGKLSAFSLAPKRAVRSVRRDAAVIREAAS
ncbi:MAG: phage holin family protein [Tabrizicola sp.]|nr:phage holin family protein [Tabrizicola sp.]